jgi:hypothetical protein
MVETTVYRSIELDTDHYLCAKVNSPPRWLNKNINKKVPSNQEEFFKIRLLNDERIRWLYTQRMKFHLNSIKEKETDTEKEWENLQNILKSAAYESLGENKETKEEEVSTNMGSLNKTINRSKEKNHTRNG